MSKKQDLKNEKSRANRAYINAYKAVRGCAVCGECRVDCLDLHHRVTALKSFELSHARDRSIDKIDVELAKCDVLCANCHRVLHAEERAVGIAIQQLSEKLPLFD